MRKILTDFTGGEVTDRLMARIDTPIYPRTCQIMENFIVHASGGADLRPGTYYCGETCPQSDIVRLIPFVRSATEKYVLELTNYIIRVWKDGELVQSGGSDLMITTPWTEDDLFELKYAQTEDAIYFAHPDYQLTKLRYFSENGWVLTNASDPFYFAIAHAASEYISIYSFNETDVFEKKTDPGTLPTGDANDCFFSHSGLYFAVVHATSPYITIYKRSGDVFAKLDNPADLPVNTAYACAFSPTDQYLAVGYGGAVGFLIIYKRDGDTFTKLDDPGTLPTDDVRGVAFSPDGTYLAVAHFTSPYITIYKRNGDVFTKLTNPADLPTGGGYDCAFSPDGNYLAVGHETSPYITIYKRSGDTFSKLANPGTLPASRVNGVAFSHSGVYLACGGIGAPHVNIYKRSGDVFTKLANPAALPGQTCSKCSFSADDLYLAFSHGVAPYHIIYKRDGDTFTKLDDLVVLPDGNGLSARFSSEGWRGIPWGTDYPAALTFHEQRFAVGRDRTIWASRVGFLQDFREDAADGSYGYEYEFASDVLEKIRWMITKQHSIVIGTHYGEWLMSGGGAPITASNVYIERVSAHGSANIAALSANESILFVQKGGQRLREFMYSEERGGYISPDLTLLADHIGVEIFKEMEWQRSPRSILWTVRNNGELAALTLDRNHDIQAWSRHPTEGTVESIAVIPGTDEDIVYIAVKRFIDEGYIKYIEYLMPINRPEDEEDYFFVDCGKTYDYTATADWLTGATQTSPVVITAGAHPFANDDLVRISDVVGMTELNGNVYMVKNKAANTFELYETDGVTPVNGVGFTPYVSDGLAEKVVKDLDGLTHLEGEVVKVYADGEELGDETVSVGAITIDEYAAKIHVGLPFTGKLETQRLGNFSNVRVPEAVLLLYKTRGGKIGPDASNLYPIVYDSDAVMTGAQEVRIDGKFSREGSIVIVQDQTYPMTLLGLVADMIVED